MKHILVTGGAGFIGSNLTLALQAKYPEARITVIDDFRSGDFRNLEGFTGDFITADVSRLDWQAALGNTRFDAIFHEASITDTTVHDQFLQGHDNIEGFRKLLEFARPNLTPIVYASSAATYGTDGGLMKIEQPPRPANIYAFSKVQLDNLAARARQDHPEWSITGLKYFNVYGPREPHKLKAASMIYQLYMQMKEGRRPRVFKNGEHRRDFVYVKDVVAITIRAAEANRPGLYNCGSGYAFSFNDVIDAVNGFLGTTYAPEYIDNPYDFYQPHTEADMSLTIENLGIQPQWDPASGIPDYLSLIHQ